MLNAFAYYILIYPVSLLPLRVMYIFTDLFFLLLITVIPYRRKVVRENIKRSFPKKTNRERKKIEHKFYRHLTDLLAEGTKNMSISKTQLLKRFTVTNPEILNNLFTKNKDVLLVSGHLNNWEWLITAQDLLFKHQAVGIGMPLSNPFWNKKLTERRSRYGMKVIHSKIVHDFFENKKDCTATLVLTDQSPGNERKCYWTDFLQQPTGIIFGPEMLANQYNQAVIYFVIQKVKRGYYEMTLTPITTEPRTLPYGEITEQFVRLFEASIEKEPENWLWSHKRWKKKMPLDIEDLRKKQALKFAEKYR